VVFIEQHPGRACADHVGVDDLIVRSGLPEARPVSLFEHQIP
jgi:hypothetical protein